jgi:prevent-host-death family protein
MDRRISAAELGRRLTEVLGRVRTAKETYVVEDNGDPVARLVPLATERKMTLRELIEGWHTRGVPDPEFAADLERINAADRPPENPWGSS